MENKSLRFKEEQLNFYISQCINYQDKLLLRLLFEGVYGDNCSELLNLKRSDFNKEEKSLKLHCDKNGDRTLYNISDESAYYIEQATKENVEYFNNGNDKSRNPYDYYCDNEFLIRTLKKKAKDETKRSDRSVINSRFLSFKK